MTEDLRRFNVPTFFIHGDDDQIVPIRAAALEAVKIVPGAELTVYEGDDHGICTTQKDRVNADLWRFLHKAKGEMAAA
ncbi:alpha/beta fold hydrolase [Rubellimicrobium roseum]|uniref:alpha/beta fold hydrolase n=1 Tax=Rubellimicrobium roseum TaxID=687525 RepID=UPI001FE6B90B|nr:alpha/beta hydrolase [Rubellimicrobium roseum]